MARVPSLRSVAHSPRGWSSWVSGVGWLALARAA